MLSLISSRREKQSKSKKKSQETIKYSPPWEQWKFDKAFFKTLSQYSVNHPETTLHRVLDNIRVGLEDSKELVDLIPESPFPARALVKALAYLVQLGVTISRARASVFEFSKQIVAWVLDVKSAFEASDGGRFTWTTWKNLEKMRDLIEEVCLWANARLNDKRWSRIGHGMMIGNEITEFNARIADAKSLFTDLTLINLSGGMDAIWEGIRTLILRQDHITREIEKIKGRQREQFTYIIDELEARKQAEARRLFLAQTLSPRTVANPTYDQQGKNPCDEDTRTEVLKDIMLWINDTSPSSQNFLWLSGDPGCGKSAITASIARGCKDKHILWAQFFINRNNVETTNPNSYFPSIARQLVDHSEDVARVIHDNLKTQPSLMDRITAEQAAKLFVDAIGVACYLNPSQPVVVVIDGLDETDKRRLKDTAVIFSHLFKGLSAHPNAKVFVSSRTEDEIRNPFVRNMNANQVKHVHLDISAQSSIDDVAAFLRRKVAQIVEENDLNWTDWPGEERMATLASRASGLFIWAVTVAKFLQEQIDTLGSECLNVVLNYLTADALGDINTLYNIILTLTYKEPTLAWEYEKFRRIVGAIVVLREPLSLEDLGGLLDLRQTPSSSPVDLATFVRRLRTVLVAGTDAINTKTVPRLHKSFFEFITSQEVDPRFRIDTEVSDAELAVRCLYTLRNAHAMIERPLALLPGYFRYACRFWSLHLKNAQGSTSGVAIMEKTILVSRFRRLLRYSANDEHIGPLNISLSSDRSQISTCFRNSARLWDTKSGQEIRILRGHTDTVSSVGFSPDGKQIVSGSWDGSVILWDWRTAHPIGPPLGTHLGQVLSVAFSPDGKQVASSSDDKSVRVWDTEARELDTLLTGHTAAVNSVTFSQDGQLIASGSDDTTVRLWNRNSGLPVRPSLTGHTGSVMSIAFSPDSKLIVSGSHDDTVRLWDATNGEPIGKPFPHNLGIQSVAFSPDGKHFISSYGAGNECISLWEVKTAKLIYTGPRFPGHAGGVRSIAFSPDGNNIALGSSDHKVHLLNAQTRQVIVPPFVGHTSPVISVAFSPDGNQIASASQDRTVRIWELEETPETPPQPHETAFTAFSPDGVLCVSASLEHTALLWDSRQSYSIGQSLQGNTGRLRCIAFSPDRTRIAAASMDGAIYLWDTTTCQLIATSIKDFISRVVSLRFTPDNQRIIATYVDDTDCTWMEENGKLISAPSSSVPILIQVDDGPRFFDVDEDSPNDNARLKGIRWFSAKTADAGLWAFLDGYVIRARQDGSVTVIPASTALP